MAAGPGPGAPPRRLPRRVDDVHADFVARRAGLLQALTKGASGGGLGMKMGPGGAWARGRERPFSGAMPARRGGRRARRARHLRARRDRCTHEPPREGRPACPAAPRRAPTRAPLPSPRLRRPRRLLRRRRPRPRQPVPVRRAGRDVGGRPAVRGGAAGAAGAVPRHQLCAVGRTGGGGWRGLGGVRGRKRGGKGLNDPPPRKTDPRSFICSQRRHGQRRLARPRRHPFRRLAEIGGRLLRGQARRDGSVRGGEGEGARARRPRRLRRPFLPLPLLAACASSTSSTSTPPYTRR